MTTFHLLFNFATILCITTNSPSQWKCVTMCALGSDVYIFGDDNSVHKLHKNQGRYEHTKIDMSLLFWPIVFIFKEM